VTGDAKPRKRVRASTPRARLAAYGHVAGSPCAVCGERRPVEAAHVVPRSQGGDDVRANIAPICGRCHWHVDQGASLAAFACRKGQAWLDRRYQAS
jgi:5-methylcytosine-specific restriction endonuclease McrA